MEGNTGPGGPRLLILDQPKAHKTATPTVVAGRLQHDQPHFSGALDLIPKNDASWDQTAAFAEFCVS
jgi:hypothetical protein